MNFTTDKQTTEDLNIFGKRGVNSVYAIYNRTHTRGGAELLEAMFHYPLAEEASINERSGIIRYFKDTNATFPIQSGLFDGAEHYLGKQANDPASTDLEYKVIQAGVMALMEILHHLTTFIQAIPQGSPYYPESQKLKHLLAVPELAAILQEKANGKLPHRKVVHYDWQLRFTYRENIKKILSHIYLLDVYISVAKAAAERGFVFPQALPKEQHEIRLEGVYHPEVKGAVANTIHITPESNIVFLTGANMAGKSTLMKSLGIALYLAHMGFPVPAKSMAFSVRDGIYTTINLPDNLGMGASHFYAEVLRIKKVAKELSTGKNLFIIFDELFRGTNVKDAYEATIAITEAFAKKRNCMFVVSTHIIEAGEVLKEKCTQIQFTYLPTRMDGNQPVYTYTLEQGITDDRHGMIIIQNEGILEIIRSRMNRMNKEPDNRENKDIKKEITS